MSNDTAGYVFSKTGKQRADIVHLDDLASNKEHDTQRCIPADKTGSEGTERCCSFISVSL